MYINKMINCMSYVYLLYYVNKIINCMSYVYLLYYVNKMRGATLFSLCFINEVICHIINKLGNKQIIIIITINKLIRN